MGVRTVKRVSSGKAISATVLSLLVAAAVLAPSAGATKPCPAGYYCTDSNGKYVLSVPALTYNPFLAEYADCVWKVHVDFGDGTSEEYVFDASVGLTGEHVFPTRGITYTVEIQLREGVHYKTGEPCPDYGLSPLVRYRTAAEEADDPPAEPPEEPPEPPAEQGGATPGPNPPAPDGGSATNPLTPGPAPERTGYWKRCRGAVFAHHVGCRKARRVARAAAEKLVRPGTAGARGFACRLRRGPLPSIVCKRGERRVLAPLGGGPAGQRVRLAFPDLVERGLLVGP